MAGGRYSAEIPEAYRVAVFRATGQFAPPKKFLLLVRSVSPCTAIKSKTVRKEITGTMISGTSIMHGRVYGDMLRYVAGDFV